MDFIALIADRFLTHFFASGGLLIACSLGWMVAKRKARNLDRYEPIILPALVILWVTATREAYDVWNGGKLVKSVFDFISWTLGVAVWGWAVTKLAKFWVSRKES